MFFSGGHEEAFFCGEWDTNSTTKRWTSEMQATRDNDSYLLWKDEDPLNELANYEQIPKYTCEGCKCTLDHA